MNDLKLFTGFKDELTKLFKVACKKLDKLSTINVLLIIFLVLYVVFDSISNFFLLIFYSSAEFIGQFFGKNIHRTTDATSFREYGIFLFVAFISCLFIVKKHLSGKLW